VPLDAALVKSAARRAGFHACGIARAAPLDPAPLDRMLARGAEADMAWLRTQRAERLDPARLLPGVRSVVVAALGYGAPGEAPSAPEGAGEIARYARGRDYHSVMKPRLRALAAEISAAEPGARTLATCDVAPVMEKAWAERAGVGWVGKNGCLITAEHGSWCSSGRCSWTATSSRTRLTRSAAVPARRASPRVDRRDPEPGLVDARRCISFWTIERRGEVPPDMAGRMGRWIFGCDACQTACPWNAAAKPACDPDLLPRPGREALAIDDLLGSREDDYRLRFYGTSLARARYDGLVRNALLAAGTSGDRRYLDAVRARLDSPFPGVRAAAEWAAARLAP